MSGSTQASGTITIPGQNGASLSYTLSLATVAGALPSTTGTTTTATTGTTTSGTTTTSAPVQPVSAYMISVPAAGGSVTISPNGAMFTTLQLNPVAPLSGLTVTMPTTAPDGAIVRLSTTQAIYWLSIVTASGQTMGPMVPNVILAGTSVAFQLMSNVWYRQ
jgi:hypothetical protein